MLPFGVTFPATLPQGSEIPEGLVNNPVLIKRWLRKRICANYRTRGWAIPVVRLNILKKSPSTLPRIQA